MQKKISKLLSREEIALFQRLATPSKIQDYLDKTPFNFERKGETYRSPRGVVRHKEAHCFEGALFASFCLYCQGRPALLLDLKTNDLKNDADHVVALFKEKNKWGAISKTNHSVLRWRDPIYLSPRELAASYFHEYFLNDGTKTLQSFSEPFDIISRFGINWLISDEDLDDIALALDRSKHYNFYSKGQKRFIRKTSPLEIKASLAEEFKNNK